MAHKYTDKQREFIKNNVEGRGNKELAEMVNEKFGLNLKSSQIKSYKGNHGLSSGLDGKFEKGNKPWNKGKKGICTGGKATQFKKGSIPPNRVSIGTERIDSKDGYTYVKIQDGHLNKNWKLKHVLIWEKYNGPVPKGHAVIFGDGDNQNFDIHNLILVSRKQLLILNRNNLIQSDTDLTRTGVIIADLYRKISERKKAQ